MRNNQISDASKMLAYLKREEAFYKRALQHMEKEYVRLQIEELTLKAAIRQEQLKVNDMQHKDDIPDPAISTGQEDNYNCDALSSKIDEQNLNNEILHTDHSSQRSSNLQSSQAYDVYSNITDDRYLEPLILNPTSYCDDELIEFDD